MRLLDARLDINLSCNYRCIFCGEPAKKENADLPLDIIDTLFPLLNNSCWSVFLSCGGEPTLHPHFNAIMANVRKYLTKPDVSIVTNGFNLDNSKIDAIINSNISRVYISLHTVDSQLYSELTGTANGAIDKVKRNILKLLEKRGTRKFPKVIITTIAMKKTIPTLDALADWIITSGADAMNVQWLLPEYNSDMKEEVVGLNTEIRKILDSVYSKLTKNKIYFYYPYSLGKEKIFTMFKDAALIKNKINYFVFLAKKFFAAIKKNGCRVIGNTFIVMQDGTIQLCHKNVHSITYSTWKNEISLQHIINGAVKKVRRTDATKCVNCPYYKKKE